MYKLYKTTDGLEGVIRTNENGTTTSILPFSDSTDYQAYLKWVAEGNTPLPAEE
jgi:hypothetical protein